MRTVPTLFFAAALAVSPLAAVAPPANAAGGPCQYAGTAQGGGVHMQQCLACMNAGGNTPAASRACGVPILTTPACEQAGVCGNGYRTNPAPPCPPLCVPPGTFPTGPVPAPVPPQPVDPNNGGWPAGPNDTWLR